MVITQPQKEAYALIHSLGIVMLLLALLLGIVLAAFLCFQTAFGS